MPEAVSVGLADRDYMRDVPEYRRVTGREPDTRADPFSGRVTRTPRGFWNQPVGLGTAIGGLVLGLVLIVLPHLTIIGRHWHLYLLP